MLAKSSSLSPRSEARTFDSIFIKEKSVVVEERTFDSILKTKVFIVLLLKRERLTALLVKTEALTVLLLKRSVNSTIVEDSNDKK